MYSIPILLVTFNRPDKTLAVINAIKEIKPKYLYIFSDGPRLGSDDDTKKIAEVRCLLKKISSDWECECEVLFEEKNLGCGKGPFTAISWFFSKVEAGIILEDDCLPTSSFFLFCEDMLVKYKDNNRVMAIAGTNVTKGIEYSTDYVYSSFPIMWGWATWRRAWSKCDFYMTEWPRVKQEKSLGWPAENKWRLHPVYTEFFNRTYEKVFGANIDVWDHQWIFANWINNGLTVTTTKNLVSNTGFGPDATHTIHDDLGRGNLKTHILTPPYSGPSEISAHKETDDYIGKYWLTATMSYYFKIIILRIKIIRDLWLILKKVNIKKRNYFD